MAIWQVILLYKLKLHLPATHHPESYISNDRTIAEVVRKMTHLTNEYRYLINIVQIEL